jgi:hypothetical protein
MVGSHTDTDDTETFMHDNWRNVRTLQLAPKNCDRLTGVVRDHVAACKISVFFVPALRDSVVLTPVWAPMPDAIATVSGTSNDKQEKNLYARFAHLQGGRLEFLHIGMATEGSVSGLTFFPVQILARG